MENKLLINRKIWEVGVIAVIAVARAMREIVVGGIKYWRWWEDMLLVFGWLIGWMLAEIDDVFYVFVSNPQEQTSQRIKHTLEIKDYRGAWNLMQATKGERLHMPVRNILTLMVVVILGVWIVTSNGSPLGSGVVLGLGVRLLSEFLAESDKNKWYWIFSREFSSNEQMWITVGCTAALVWQALMTVRG